MVESLFRIPNISWAGVRFEPPLPVDGADGLAAALAGLNGRFSLALRGPQDRLILARDRLGLNKLFFALGADGTATAANYLADLVDRGIPFEAIYSVPAGHVLEIDLRRRTLVLRRFFDVDAVARADTLPLEVEARRIRRHLELWFARLANRFGGRRICVCLSGGLDSSLIAALAARHFADVAAYTYGYADAPESEDMRSARRVAEALGLRLRRVPATARDVLDVLDDALCYGQDWRAFNVHCAIVNELLARAIARDARGAAGQPAPLALTGDLMNEILADYVPLSHAGRDIYTLPRVGAARLRAALLRGLDAGDREVGIFGHHGIEVVQPYGLVLDQLLPLPASFLGGEGAKQRLARAMAGDLLPAFVFARTKARAQVGDARGPGGIVSTLEAAGRDARWLRGAFCRRFGIEEEGSLDGFIRVGRYRFPREYPRTGKA
ncbi:MAG: 7-cyano-7-deazaguanine synthase [Candidatus Rokubacteria bacterium]|nr:7-cyano-7-deazaguanine synthase [Candidatus Rokubacteria bacterium]